MSDDDFLTWARRGPAPPPGLLTCGRDPASLPTATDLDRAEIDDERSSTMRPSEPTSATTPGATAKVEITSHLKRLAGIEPAEG